MRHTHAPGYWGRPGEDRKLGTRCGRTQHRGYVFKDAALVTCPTCIEALSYEVFTRLNKPRVLTQEEMEESFNQIRGAERAARMSNSRG